MKPDWQNKSYAKTSSPTAPSTTHPKLKLGMTSLHSKIAVANNNMPQAPKPAVRKFADGGVIRTRSDEEIGDTPNYPGAKPDPGSFDRRMAEGEKNMQRLRSLGDSISSFFSKEDKASTEKASSDNITNVSGGNKSDEAKAAIISAAMDKKPETVVTEEPRRKITDYMVKKSEGQSDSVTSAAPEPAPPPAAKEAAPVEKKAAPVVKKAAPVVKKVKKPEVKTDSKNPDPKPVPKIYNEDGTPNIVSSSASNLQESSRPVPPAVKVKNTAGRMNTIGNSQKDIEYIVQQKNRQRQIEQDSNTDTGDETKRLRDRTSTFVPGFGQIDKEGKIIPNVRGGLQASQVYGAKEDSFMESAEKRYLKSRIAAGNLTAMEKAQAKRAGLL
jgi:hypothetical protein